MAKSHVLSGAKVKLYINERPFGQATSFRWSSNTPKKALRGIDVLEPVELAVTGYQCTGSVSVIRLSNDGGAEGAGVITPYPELSREKYFSLTLIERHTDLVIFRANRCSLLSQSWEIPVRGIVTGNFSFEALEWTNEIFGAGSR